MFLYWLVCIRMSTVGSCAHPMISKTQSAHNRKTQQRLAADVIVLNLIIGLFPFNESLLFWTMEITYVRSSFQANAEGRRAVSIDARHGLECCAVLRSRRLKLLTRQAP